MTAALAAVVLLGPGCTARADVESSAGNESGVTIPEASSWRVHDMDRPNPSAITPADQSLPVPPPQGAVVLFDGKDLSHWVSSDGSAPQWKVANGYLETVPSTGPIHTTDTFGDVQLHVEWATPNPPHGTGQDRGNSGIFLMRRYEVQVLDSYNADTYADGQAGALYGEYPPLYNATRAPGEWQAYDIYFRRPRFNADSSLAEPARMTVVLNGVLIQDNEVMTGPTTWLHHFPYRAHADALPLELQDHNHPVRYRNIWALPMPERPEPPASYATALKPVDLTTAQMDALVGRYGSAEGQPFITVARSGDSLTALFAGRTDPFETVAVAPNELDLKYTAGRLVFDLDDQGTATGLTFHLGGDEMKQPKQQ